MEKTVWGGLIQKPLGTQGKRKTTTPTAPKDQKWGCLDTKTSES